MRKRFLSLILALAMVFSLLPAAALAAEGDAQATVTVSFSAGDTFYFQPTKVAVRAGLAAEYGFGAPSEQPTALDAAVAAHAAKYGDAFTPDTAEDYMNASFTRLFGREDGFYGHYLNGCYVTTGQDQTVVSDGDVVELFAYSNDFLSAPLGVFTSEGKPVFSAATTDGTLTLSLMKAPDYSVPDYLPAAGVTVGVMGEDGKLTAEGLTTTAVSNADGSVTLTFTQNGEVCLMSGGTCQGQDFYPAWCKVTVSGALTEERMRELVEADKAALDVTYTVGQNLTLPSVGQSGMTSIAWTSDTPQVVHNDGVVVRDGEDHSVTLTATVTCGTVSGTRDFSLTIPALSDGEARAMLTQAVDKLTADPLAPVEYTGFDETSGYGYFSDSQPKDTDLTVMAGEIIGDNAVTVTIAESRNSAVASDGVITYGESESAGQVTFRLAAGALTQDCPVDVTVPAHLKNKAEYLDEMKAALTFDAIRGDNESADNVTKDMSLPGKLDGMDFDWYDYLMMEVKVSWTSSHPDVVYIPDYWSDPTSAKITRPEEVTQVTLTASLAYDTTYEVYGGMGILPPGPMPEGEQTAEITFTVNPLTDEERSAILEELNGALATVTADKITAYAEGTDDDTHESANLDNVTYDLHLCDLDSSDPYWKSGVRLSWSTDNPAIAVNYLRAKVTRPAGTENATGLLTVTANKVGVTASKSFPVTVLASGNEALPEIPGLDDAIEGITSAYAAKDADWWTGADWWHAAAMGAYTLRSGRDKLSADQKQALANQLIALAAENAALIGGTDASEASVATGLANVVNGLSAMGFDPEQITTINHTVVQAGSALARVNLDGARLGLFTTGAPYVLMGLRQGGYGDDALTDSLIDYLLSQQQPDGGWKSWSQESDSDSTAIVLQGLTLSDRADARTACNTALKFLADAFKALDEPTFGNANSDAIAILALAQIGVDPSSDPRFVKDGKSLVDGLMGYLNPDKTAFQFSGADNDYATKQGLAALLAAGQIRGKATPVDILDFSAVEKVPVSATSAGTVVAPPDPSGSDITVTVTVKADTGYWLNAKSVTVPGTGATVYHAIVNALAGSGITQVGAESGYIRSMTYNGRTLEEFGQGPDSGWLYKVNGYMPDVAITSYPIQGGDAIVLYYTEDWVQDPSAGIFVGGGSSGSDVTGAVVSPEAAAGPDGQARAAVSDRAVDEALKQAQADSSVTAITVSPQITGDADKVIVELTGPSAAKIAEAGLSLIVNTGLGGVTLPAASLAGLTGEKIAVSVARLEDGSAAFEVSADGKAAERLSGGMKVRLPLTGSGNVLVRLSDGAEIVLRKSLVQDGQICALLDGSAVVKAALLGQTFSDVGQAQWFAGAVDFASSHELFQGVGEGAFAPDAPMTRGMLATVLWRMEGEMPDGELGYADVPVGSWYEPAIRWADAHSIVKGYSEDLFGPEDNITREQLATMLWRYAKDLGMDLSASDDLSGFADRDALSGYAAEAMQWAVGSGIIRGRADGTLDPGGNATRAEVAQILQRLTGLMVL